MHTTPLGLLNCKNKLLASYIQSLTRYRTKSPRLRLFVFITPPLYIMLSQVNRLIVFPVRPTVSIVHHTPLPSPFFNSYFSPLLRPDKTQQQQHHHHNSNIDTQPTTSIHALQCTRWYCTRGLLHSRPSIIAYPPKLKQFIVKCSLSLESSSTHSTPSQVSKLG